MHDFKDEWFHDIPVIGAQPPSDAALKLREMADYELADLIEAAHVRVPDSVDMFGKIPLFTAAKPWQHTAHAFGHIEPTAAKRTELLPIEHAGNIDPDTSLRGTRIKITLDRLRVADYPGKGTHHVLFDFYAQNQVPSAVEHLHFNATLRAREGERAAVVGYPIFVALNVGLDGVAFKCFTVNVKNEEDEAFLGFLESDVFRTGLKLAMTAQPALAPLSYVAFSLTKFIAQRHRNTPVQDFYLGLDFSTIVTRARLAEGSYVAVQVPETLQAVWNWLEWGYQPTTGQIVNRADPSKLLTYNYLVFGVSRYEGT